MSNSDAIFDKASERTLWSCIDREGGCRAASLPNSAALAVHFPPIPFTEHKWPGSNYAERRAKLTGEGPENRERLQAKFDGLSWRLWKIATESVTVC